MSVWYGGLINKRGNKPKRQKIKKCKRIALAEAQNWRCAYCGCVMEIETSTADHVVPRSKGGSNFHTNLVAACFLCNQERGAMPAIDFWFSKNVQVEFSEYCRLQDRQSRRAAA